MKNDTPAASPDAFDEASAVASAIADADDKGELEWAPDLADSDIDDGVVGSSPITSHVLVTAIKYGNRYYINDKSSFKSPHTDQYECRVALYNKGGIRVYLGPWRAKGGGNGYNTLLHTEAVWDDGRLTRKSLVLWRSVNAQEVWTNWANG